MAKIPQTPAPANPISNPAAFDVYKLDKLFSPFSRILECNGRELTWQEQQAPGYAGAFVVFRGEKLVTVTYGVEIIDRPGFGTVQTMLDYCNAAKTSRPPRGMRLVDLRLAALRIPQVAVARVPWMELESPGHWIFKFKFQEYRRLRIAGGPPQAPRNAFETKIAVATKELSGATADADAAVSAARAAAAERARRNGHFGR
jgi:hypothetical protein